LAFPCANATDLAAAQQALNIISEFADKLCITPALEGGTQGVELSGAAKAELNGVIKEIANLGVEGAAKYQAEHYKGLLQKDLVSVLRDSSNCRLEVWRDLKDKLLPVGLTIAHPASKNHPQQKTTTEQQVLIEKLKQSEEQNRRIEVAMRLAKAEVEAEAAMRNFSIRNNLGVIDPTPDQLRTLSVLFRENVRANEIDIYLDLMVAGVGLYLVEENPGSLRRLRSILDAASQVGDGSNIGMAIKGNTRKERLSSFAQLLRSAKLPFDDESVEDLRKDALRYPSLTLN